MSSDAALGVRKCDVAECEAVGDVYSAGWHWSPGMCDVLLCPDHAKGFRRTIVVAPPAKEAKKKHRETP